MEVFRLANKNFADLTGKGGLYSSGRWHTQGKSVVYAASSRSLSVLERFIHEHSLSIPDLLMLTIYIPDELAHETITTEQMVDNWDTTNIGEQSATQRIGDEFLKGLRKAFKKVPSAIVPHEYNFIINPVHPDAKRIKIIDQHDYRYDERYQRFIKR